MPKRNAGAAARERAFSIKDIRGYLQPFINPCQSATRDYAECRPPFRYVADGGKTKLDCRSPCIVHIVRWLFPLLRHTPKSVIAGGKQEIFFEKSRHVRNRWNVTLIQHADRDFSINLFQNDEHGVNPLKAATNVEHHIQMLEQLTEDSKDEKKRALYFREYASDPFRGRIAAFAGPARVSEVYLVLGSGPVPPEGVAVGFPNSFPAWQRFDKFLVVPTMGNESISYALNIPL